MKSIHITTLLLLCSFTSAFAGKYETTIRNFWTAVDAGNFDLAATYLHPDLKVNIPISAEQVSLEGYIQIGKTFRGGFPDIQHKVLEVAENKKSAAVRGWFSGTNTGILMGNPATGNRVELGFLQLWHFDAKGKAIRIELSFDMASFNAQLMKGLPDLKKIAETTVRELYERMDAGQVDRFKDYCSADFRIFNPFLSEPSPIEAFQGIIQGQKSGFPDMKHEIVELITDGKTVTSKGYFKGTNKGVLMGNPPTGNKVELPFLVLDEMDAQGKIKNRFVQFDAKAFETQLMKGLPDNKQIASHMMAELNHKHLDAVLQACAPNARFNGWAPQPVDGNGYKQAMSELLAAFPDARFTVQDIIADGDKVVVRHQLEGTHTGSPLLGVAKTGKRVMVPATVVIQYENGKAKELWLNADFFGMFMQLGASPVMTAKK